MKLKVTSDIEQRTLDIINWLEVTRQRLQGVKKHCLVLVGGRWIYAPEDCYKIAFMDYLKAQIEYSHLVLLYFGEEYIEKLRYEDNVYYND